MFNIINPDAVRDFLRSQADGNPLLASLMQQCLLRPLKHERSALQQVRTFPQRAPPWLTPERFASDGPFYRFSRRSLRESPKLMEAVWQVKRWLRVAIESDQSWVRERDADGRAPRLRNIGRLPHALLLAEKDMRIRLGHSALAQPLPIDGHLKFILQVGGLVWAQLMTPAALREEGVLMRHCLGNGGYDLLLNSAEFEFYSLRDARGQSHVTLEVRRGLVAQRRGRANSAPSLRYRQALDALIRLKGWAQIAPWQKSERAAPGSLHAVHCVDTQLTQSGHLAMEGADGSVRLPRFLSVQGNFDLATVRSLVALPEHLSVGGDLRIRGAIDLVAMPRWLWVRGNLLLDGCPSLCVLGERIAIAGSLTIRGCTQLERLPEHLIVGRDLELAHCSRLAPLSPHTKVRGCFKIAGRDWFLVQDANRQLARIRAESPVPSRALH